MGINEILMHFFVKECLRNCCHGIAIGELMPNETLTSLTLLLARHRSFIVLIGVKIM